MMVLKCTGAADSTCVQHLSSTSSQSMCETERTILVHYCMPNPHPSRDPQKFIMQGSLVNSGISEYSVIYSVMQEKIYLSSKL